MSSPGSRNSYRTGCSEVGKNMMISGIVEIIVIVIIFVMLIVAAAYNNKTDPTDPAEIEAKVKYMNNLIVGSAVVSLVLVAIGIWHLLASNAVRKCITNTSS